MRAIRVSKFFLASGRLSRYDSSRRQLTMNLVDGTRWHCRAYDLDRGGKRDCWLCDSLTLPMIRFNPALYPSGVCYSSGKRLLAVIGADLDTRRAADSMIPVPTDDAGGMRLR